jgi:hypothetical protein
MRKRTLTLLEVLLAATLLSILMGCLFYSQKEAAVINNHIGQIKQNLLIEERFRLKLGIILNKKTDLKWHEAGLLIQYDNGVDMDAAFCGPVISHLFYDNHKILLVTWPLEAAAPERVEVLLEQVNNLSFFFYDEELNTFISDSQPPQDMTLMKIKVDATEFPFFL